MQGETVQKRVHKSLKLWSMYADLEESLGTFQSTKAVYSRVLDLRIANPQIIINYALFLEEHRYFEESFKVSVFYYVPLKSFTRVSVYTADRFIL